MVDAEGKTETSRSVGARTMLWVAIGCGVLFWIIDGAVDAFLFYDSTLAQELLSPEPVEIWMRSVVLCLMLAFGVYAQFSITKREQAEQALVASKRHNEMILASAGEGIFGLDLEGRTTFVNPAAARMIGWQVEELLRKPQHAILHHSKPDGSPYPRQECPIYAAFKDGAVHHVDTEVFWRKDGSSFPVEYTSTPIRDEQGQLAGAVVTFRDTTEPKRAEDALRSSEQLYTQIAKHLRETLFVVDHKDYRVLYVNPAYEEIWNRTCESLYEHPASWVDAIAPEDAERVKRALEKQQRTGEFNEEFQIVWPDGSVRWIHDRVYPIQNEQGEIYRLVGIAEDITERKRAEAALCDSEERYELAARATFNAIWDWDFATDLVKWNEGVQSLFGYAPDAIGPDAIWWKEHIHPEDRDRVVHGIHAVIESDQVHWKDEYRFRCFDGTYALVIDRGAVVRDGTGKAIRMVGAMDDITERKRAEEALRRAHDELEARVAERTSDLTEANRQLEAEITVRKRVEADLRASEERFRTFMNNNPAVAFLKDEEGHYLYVNEPLCRFFSQPQEAWLGKTVFDLWPPEVAGPVYEHDREVMAGNHLVEIEETVPTPDGEEHHWLAFKFPLQNQSGDTFLEGIGIDITDRKRAEEALRDAEIRSRTLLEGSPVCNKIIDLDSRLLYMSAAGQQQLKIPDIEPFYGCTYPPDFFPESTRASLTEHLERAKAGEIASLECPARDMEGCEVWYHTTFVPARDDEGRIEYIIATSVNITERKRAENALRERTERYELVAEGACDAIWDWDVLNHRVYFSPRWKELRGLAPDEVSDRDEEWSSRIHPDDVPRVMAAVQAHFEGQTEFFEEEYRTRCKDGSFNWVLDRGVARRDAAGNVVRMAGSESDITERKRAEEAVRDSEQRLRQLLKDRERLNQDLHDGILQSLYAVGLTLETSKLMGQKTPRQAVRKVDHGIRLLNTVIQEVRNFITGPKAEPMGGVQFTTTLATLVRSMGHTGSLHFLVDVDAVAAKRLTDVQRLHLLSIAKEALSNSVRHSGGRQGFVSLRRHRDSVRFEVKDDGVGFSTPSPASTGQGLRNMDARAQQMDSRFTLNTKPGQGTQILVDIPCRDS